MPSGADLRHATANSIMQDAVLVSVPEAESSQLVGSRSAERHRQARSCRVFNSDAHRQVRAGRARGPDLGKGASGAAVQNMRLMLGLGKVLERA